LLTQLVENLLNRNLAASPRARALCEALRARTLRIVLRGTPWAVDINSDGRSLRLDSTQGGSSATAPDATLDGTPVSLLRLAGTDPERLIQDGTVLLRGDLELARQYRELALLLRPDLEEELSRLLGDGAASGAGRFARSLLAAGRRVGVTTARNTAEYLAHESGDLVPRGEAEAWFDAVDRAREDADRLEARLERLEQRSNETAP
jgi:ubiquinone biosynthesis accessory factor UbiJ